MERDTDQPSYSRRSVLAAGGAVAVSAGLAGCTGGGGDATETTGTTDTATATKT